MLGLGLDSVGLVYILGLGLASGKYGKFGQLNKVKRVKEYYSLIQNISLMENVPVHKCSLHYKRYNCICDQLFSTVCTRKH